MTGLVVVSSVIGNPNIDTISLDGGKLTYAAFNQIPLIGTVVLTFGLITFAFSTILGWSYYGERCAEYLFGSKINIPYRFLYVIVTFVGSTVALDLVWDIADALNALMAIPNLVAVLLLSNLIVKETKHYLGNIDDLDTDPIPSRK
jgi:AGCS family alanine or glycine:cation symporter